MELENATPNDLVSRGIMRELSQGEIITLLENIWKARGK